MRYCRGSEILRCCYHPPIWLLGKSTVDATDESGDRLLQELNQALETRPDDILVARTRLFAVRAVVS